MIRVTLKDDEQMISFLTSRDIARRLVAGCAANPGTAGELLRATEVFQRGITIAVTAKLIEFDKALMARDGNPVDAVARETSAETADRSFNVQNTVQSAFQAVDAETEALALSPTESGLLLLDLTAHTIASRGFDVQREGEILARGASLAADQPTHTNPAITYVLPKEWAIQAL